MTSKVIPLPVEGASREEEHAYFKKVFDELHEQIATLNKAVETTENQRQLRAWAVDRVMRALERRETLPHADEVIAYAEALKNYADGGLASE